MADLTPEKENTVFTEGKGYMNSKLVWKILKMEKSLPESGTEKNTDASAVPISTAPHRLSIYA
jgi:hypothetical protein